MFERFDEQARQALFFARYAVTQLGGETLEPEHVVIGVLKCAPAAVVRFARIGETAEGLRARIEGHGIPREKLSTSVEIPFSHQMREVIERTPIEADDLGNPWIRPEHLILGVLVKSSGTAARVLHDAG